MMIVKPVHAKRPNGEVIGPVQAGVTYHLRAGGFYWDAITPCSADGYTFPLAYLVGLPPTHRDGIRYMRLWGCIVPEGKEPGPGAEWFKLGSEAKFKARTSGDLWAMANDRPGFLGTT